tara:strand:- start:3559 stop:6861 length:3303 start_codon:yes stop_codon:yes gene_type:complete
MTPLRPLSSIESTPKGYEEPAIAIETPEKKGLKDHWDFINSSVKNWVNEQKDTIENFDKDYEKVETGVGFGIGVGTYGGVQPQYRNKNTGELTTSTPSRKQIDSAVFVDAPANAIKLGLNALTRLAVGWDYKNDPNDIIPIDRIRDDLKKRMGAKPSYELTSSEKFLFEDLPVTATGVVLGSVVSAPIVGSKGFLAATANLAPKIKWAVRGGTAIGIEEFFGSAVESNVRGGGGGSLAEFFPGSPLAINPDDDEFTGFLKAGTVNSAISASLLGLFSFTAKGLKDLPNIARHKSQKRVIQEVDNARTWTEDVNLQFKREDGSWSFTDEATEATEDIKVGIEEAPTKTEDVTEEVSPTKPKEESTAPKSFDEAADKLAGIDKPEVDTYVRAADRLDTPSLERAADSDGSVSDALEKELADQDAEFEQWRKDPDNEYRELFDEIDETLESTEQAPDFVTKPTAEAPDSVVSFVEQWEGVPYPKLKSLASKKADNGLFDKIREITGRNYNQFIRQDILDGLSALRKDGITISPTKAEGGIDSVARRQEAKIKLIKKAIKQGEVRPSATNPAPLPKDPSVDPLDPNASRAEIIGEEVRLSQEYAAADDLRRENIIERERERTGYYDSSLEEQKANGLLDEWEETEADKLQVERLQDELNGINDQMVELENLMEERATRGVGAGQKEEMDYMDLMNRRDEARAEIEELGSTPDFSMGDEQSVAKYQYENTKFGRENLENDPNARRLFLKDIVDRVAGKDAGLHVKLDARTEIIPKEWGGDGVMTSPVNGHYEVMKDIIVVQELMTRSIQDIMSTTYHESLHRIQYGLLTLEEMKLFNTAFSQRRITDLALKHRSDALPWKVSTLERMAIGFQHYSMLRSSGISVKGDLIHAELANWMDLKIPRLDGKTWSEGNTFKVVKQIAIGFEKVIDLVDRINNARKGLGFQTVEDMFERMYRGDIARERKFNSVMSVGDRLDKIIPEENLMANLTRKRVKQMKKLDELIKITDAMYADPKTPIKDLNEANKAMTQQMEILNKIDEGMALQRKNVDALWAADPTLKTDNERLAVLARWQKDNVLYAERYKELLAGIDGNIESLKSKAISGGC